MVASTSQTIAQPFDFTIETFHGKQRGLWSQALQRLIRNRLALVSAVLLVVILAVSVLAEFVPVVANHDPALTNFPKTEAQPSAEYWLGADKLGRDLWARLLSGTLFSLKIGLIGMAIVLVLGVTVGMAASLGGRWTDGILMWITDLAFAFPDLLAIILLRQVLLGRDWLNWVDSVPGLSSSLAVTVLAISFVAWVTIARLVRGQMLSIREQDYVLAARSIGCSQWRIVRSHMLPNTLSAIIVAITFGIPGLIFAEAALGFIGLSVPSPGTSLGTLIGSGLDSVRTNSIELIWPAIMVALLMLCFTFLGDGLRDALDPRTRK